MKKQRNKNCRYAVIVSTENGFKFVTKLVGHDAYWNDNEKALIMGNEEKELAYDVAGGLCMNFFLALVVEVPDCIHSLGNRSIPAPEPNIETK
mgnify:FL=1